MMAAWLLLFVAGVAVSLSASWLLVSRLERLGERAGLSEAWLGLVAALAADAPEITSAVTALARGQSSIGAGVVIGSNVFNLAALLGLSALLTGRWALTAAASCFAFALGVVLGVPDQIFATITQYAFLAAIAAVSMTATTSAAILQRQRP